MHPLSELVPLAARHQTPFVLASFLSPELVDVVAGYIAIFVLFFVPALLIYIFWMVHILPEKIAEKRGHPQAPAIKTLCLLSLAFGGLLWPLAWLWAYSKPVFYKMAYGTDVEHAHGPQPVPEAAEPGHVAAAAGTPLVESVRVEPVRVEPVRVAPAPATERPTGDAADRDDLITVGPVPGKH